MPEGQPRAGLADLNERSRDILRHIVDAYMESGEPVGSRTISRRLAMSLSPATIRNVMADLEEAGLLYAPHTSAGRLPTERGLSLFVSGLLELGGLSKEEREKIDGKCAAAGRSLADVLEDATTMLSGLSRCAGLVVAPKTERRLKHIEFVHLGPGRALVVMVTEDGLVENRIIDVPMGLPPASLIEATNYMSARLVGRTLGEARSGVLTELEQHRAELDALTSRVVEAGLATWAGEKKGGALIIRGQAHLLDEVTALSDLERIRALFAALETKEAMVRLLEAADLAQGVQIFIGAQNELFGLAGCSVIIAPYRNSREQIVGAVGVIGPTRINYARIIPMVDYTAQVIGRILA
ncbi:MAG TPA: heat-inducible transcriptional repressor HrcA [Candidatus Angelobacter sp.]|nr:heat-inducible transcriptional repressor HrcA [Candidatus Angelobacter sp.]